MSVSSSVGGRRYAQRDLMSRLEISTAAQFPARPDTDVLYEIHADLTDPHTSESFKAGDVIAWDYDHQEWVGIGSKDTDEQQLDVNVADEKITLERGGEVDLTPILDARAEDDQAISSDVPSEEIRLEDGGVADLTPILDHRGENVDRSNAKFFRTYFDNGVQMHEEVV